MRYLVLFMLFSVSLSLRANAQGKGVTLSGGNTTGKTDDKWEERIVGYRHYKVPVKHNVDKERSLTERERQFLATVPESVPGTPKFRVMLEEMLRTHWPGQPGNSLIHVPEGGRYRTGSSDHYLSMYQNLYSPYYVEFDVPIVQGPAGSPGQPGNDGRTGADGRAGRDGQDGRQAAAPPAQQPAPQYIYQPAPVINYMQPVSHGIMIVKKPNLVSDLIHAAGWYFAAGALRPARSTTMISGIGGPGGGISGGMFGGAGGRGGIGFGGEGGTGLGLGGSVGNVTGNSGTVAGGAGGTTTLPPITVTATGGAGGGGGGGGGAAASSS